MEIVRRTNTTGHTLVVFGRIHTLGPWDIHAMHENHTKRTNEILAIPRRIRAISCKMRLQKIIASSCLGKSRKGTKGGGTERVGLQMKNKLGHNWNTHVWSLGCS